MNIHGVFEKLKLINRWNAGPVIDLIRSFGGVRRKAGGSGGKIFLWRVAVACLLVACCTSVGVRADSSFFPKGTNLTSLVVISDGNLTNTPQKVLIATLQGLVARRSARQIYIDGGSGYSIWDRQLNSDYGVALETETNPWTLLGEFRGLVSGYIRYDLSANTNSLEAANSLCGPLNAVAVDASLESAVKSAGLTNLLADVSAAGDQFVWTNTSPNYGTLLSRDVVAEQKQSFADNLRDYVAMANAFVFYEGDDAFRTEVMAAMNPDSAGLGWGDSERVSIGNSSSNGVFTCGSDWALDLSTLSSIRDSSFYQRTYNRPAAETNVHYVTFLVTDGDNVQWNLGGLPAYFDAPARGTFNMGWALSPSLADLAPSALRWYFENSSNAPNRDFFVAGPSGVGYFYPSLYPSAALGRQVQKLDDFMCRADLNLCQILDFNSFNRSDLWNQYLAQPAIDGLFYLEYAPYNGAHGAMLWSTNGKPVIGVRDLLWAGLEEETNLIANLNSYSTDSSSPGGYTLVAVHVWSKDLANVQQVVTNLASNVRVVTPDAFVRLIRDNVGRRLAFDFASGLQGWVATNATSSNSEVLGPANPGFENGGASWYSGGSGGAAGSVSFANSPSNGPSAAGTDCAAETSNGSGNTDFRAAAFSLGSAATGTNVVTFSFDYNILNPVTNGNNVRVGLRFFDSSGGNFQGESNSHIGSDNGDIGGDGWQHFSVTVTPPATAYTADIRVSMNVFGDDDWKEGTVLFDNFAVTVGVTPAPSEWTGTVGNPAGALMIAGSGSSNSAATSSFSRQIVLPANAATLSFDTMATNDGLLRVRLLGANGAYATLLDWSGLTNHEVWVTNSASLADYAGQTVTLLFEQADGGQGVNEQRYVDNVRILTAGSALYVPAAPKLLLAMSTNGVIHLLWRDNDNNESGFTLERCAGTNGVWSEIASLATNVTTYGDGTVVPGATYSYRVRSWNAAGSSPGLNIRTVTALSRTALGPLNPGFEQGSTSWNAGGTGGAAGAISFANVPTNGLSEAGTNCVAETSDGTGNADFRANQFFLGDAAAAAAPVTFSFDYNILNPVTAGDNVRVGLRFFDRSGSSFQGENNSHLGAGNGDVGRNGWQHFSVTVIPPATAYMADIRVSMNVFGDDSWSLGAVLFDNFALVIGSNQPPVATNISIGALAGVPVTLRIIDGTQAPVDSVGNPLVVSAVGAPAHGSATTDGTNITYAANAGYAGPDSFAYAVSDGIGGLATATVTAMVSLPGMRWLETPSLLSSGTFKLAFQGAPLNNYALEWTDDLTPPASWHPQATNNADAAGVLWFTNLQMGKAGFWRTRYINVVP